MLGPGGLARWGLLMCCLCSPAGGHPRHQHAITLSSASVTSRSEASSLRDLEVVGALAPSVEETYVLHKIFDSFATCKLSGSCQVLESEWPELHKALSMIPLLPQYLSPISEFRDIAMEWQLPDKKSLTGRWNVPMSVDLACYKNTLMAKYNVDATSQLILEYEKEYKSRVYKWGYGDVWGEGQQLAPPEDRKMTACAVVREHLMQSKVIGREAIDDARHLWQKENLCADEKCMKRPNKDSPLGLTFPMFLKYMKKKKLHGLKDGLLEEALFSLFNLDDLVVGELYHLESRPTVFDEDDKFERVRVQDMILTECETTLMMGSFNNRHPVGNFHLLFKTMADLSPIASKKSNFLGFQSMTAIVKSMETAHRLHKKGKDDTKVSSNFLGFQTKEPVYELDKLLQRDQLVKNDKSVCRTFYTIKTAKDEPRPKFDDHGTNWQPLCEGKCIDRHDVAAFLVLGGCGDRTGVSGTTQSQPDSKLFNHFILERLETVMDQPSVWTDDACGDTGMSYKSFLRSLSSFVYEPLYAGFVNEDLELFRRLLGKGSFGGAGSDPVKEGALRLLLAAAETIRRYSQRKAKFDDMDCEGGLRMHDLLLHPPFDRLRAHDYEVYTEPGTLLRLAHVAHLLLLSTDEQSGWNWGEVHFRGADFKGLPLTVCKGYEGYSKKSRIISTKMADEQKKRDDLRKQQEEQEKKARLDSERKKAEEERARKEANGKETVKITATVEVSGEDDSSGSQASDLLLATRAQIDPEGLIEDCDAESLRQKCVPEAETAGGSDEDKGSDAGVNICRPTVGLYCKPNEPTDSATASTTRKSPKVGVAVCKSEGEKAKCDQCLDLGLACTIGSSGGSGSCTLIENDADSPVQCGKATDDDCWKWFGFESTKAEEDLKKCLEDKLPKPITINQEIPCDEKMCDTGKGLSMVEGEAPKCTGTPPDQVKIDEHCAKQCCQEKEKEKPPASPSIQSSTEGECSLPDHAEIQNECSVTTNVIQYHTNQLQQDFCNKFYVHKNDQYHQCVLDTKNSETAFFDCKLDESRSCKDPCEGKKVPSGGQGKCSDYNGNSGNGADLNSACPTLMGAKLNDGIMYRCRYDGISTFCSASDVRCTPRLEDKVADQNGTGASAGNQQETQSDPKKGQALDNPSEVDCGSVQNVCSTGEAKDGAKCTKSPFNKESCEEECCNSDQGSNVQPTN